MNPATIRSWRRRLKAQSVPQVVDPVLRAPDDALVGGESLRQAADRAREASIRAWEIADRILARGLASEARAAADTAGRLSQRAVELEDAARAEQESQLRVTDSERRLNTLLLRSFFDAAGIPGWDGPGGHGPAARLLDALLAGLAELAPSAGASTYTIPVPEPEAREARAAVRRAFEAEVIEDYLREQAESGEPEEPEADDVQDPAMVEPAREPAGETPEVVITASSGVVDPGAGVAREDTWTRAGKHAIGTIQPWAAGRGIADAITALRAAGETEGEDSQGEVLEKALAKIGAARVSLTKSESVTPLQALETGQKLAKAERDLQTQYLHKMSGAFSGWRGRAMEERRAIDTEGSL